MKLLILFLLISFSSTSFCQQFSFQIFFKDAFGNKDTITLGYDEGATDSIDTAFGEVNIIQNPRDTAFDVRISNEFKNRRYYQTWGSYHTKKQIVGYDCTNFSFDRTQVIDIFAKHWPVTATWDSLLFDDHCRKGSFMTSINPGGWWDVRSQSNLYILEFSEKDSVTFTSNINPWYNESYGYIDGLDTVSVFWQVIGSTSILEIATKEQSEQLNAINIFPNPFSNQLTFSAQTNDEILISIYNINGQKISQEKFTNYTSIDTERFPKGIYIYKLSDSNGKTKCGKMIKQ
jgi:hypothetical protein